jgi:hypothetical protein
LGINLNQRQGDPQQKAGLQGKFQPIVSDNIVTPQEAVEVLESRGVEAAYLPFESSWSPFDPNFRSTVRSSLNDLLGGSNIASNSGYRRGRIADALAGLVDFAPAIGDAVGVGDTMTSYRQGDMLGTGINALATGVGVLPLVGGPASKAVKAGGNRVRSALNELGYGRTPNQSLNSIPFIHNTDPNTLKGSGKFGTSIEPAGQYVSPTDKLRTDFPENFIAGEKEFSKPLVINFGDGYDKPNNWKNRLSAEYDNKTGIDLTNALRADGYDGIVTVDEGGNLSEMVDLTQGKSGSALSGLELNIDDLDEDQYIQAINPQGTQIKPEARPNLGMGDMYGMASRNAEEIMTQELRSGETIRYVQDGDSVYALGYNPDLGEEDVVGYMLGGGDGSELAVVDQMQGKGIGGNLSYLYRSQNPMAQSGGFTEAGEAAARQAYRRIMGYE